MIGIGPGKSASTYIARLLQDDPRVVVGNATLGGRKCCEAELYWLLNKEEMLKGLSSYSKYFQVNTGLKTIFYEKTPRYSDDVTVPYHARVLLGPRLKLIFTLRPPAALDASLYMHRRAFEYNSNGQKMSYRMWVEERIQAYLKWIDCRRQSLKSLITMDNRQDKAITSYLNELLSSTFDWCTSALIEAYMNAQCGLGAGPNIHDPLNTILVVNGMRRWFHVYNNPDQWLCITTDMMFHYPDQVKEALSLFIGRDNNSSLSLNTHSIPEPPIEGRLRQCLIEVHEQKFSISLSILVKEIEASVARLTNFITRHRECEDHDLFLSACGFIPPGFHSCKLKIEKRL
uniref:Sulfotransferase domain-containing protein n=1 Tax=Aureoumbra lagunensis TaxID=44058 RepID=A0A7S3NNS5_9STRA|mmetsp:Transcript_2666/g.4263  ORF Transcript_2666/g.4263 Transcript_2666/m.4263 type:complete len:344 (-) Transcript_2666:567-1598(-)